MSEHQRKHNTTFQKWMRELAAQPQPAAAPSEWNRATRCNYEHLAKSDEDGCCCEFHRLLNERNRQAASAALERLEKRVEQYRLGAFAEQERNRIEGNESIEIQWRGIRIAYERSLAAIREEMQR